MLRPVLALSLVGLGAAHVVPGSKTLNDRQSWWGIGSGWSGFPTGTPAPCLSNDIPGAQQTPCLLPPITSGGVIPGKEKRQGGVNFGGSGNDKDKAIQALELQLLQLQNKPDPTDDDLEQIANLQAMLLYVEGITSISAPPGVGSTFTHSGKRFTLPPDYNSNVNHAIDELERQLEQLQNKRNKTDDDYDQIRDIKAALRYLAGIGSISAPPGTSTTFHPGKRFTLPPDYNSDVNHAIDELERQLEQLQNKRHKTDDDYDEIRDIKAALKYLAGITNISAPPGTSTTFHPGKRFTLPPDYNSNVNHAIDELEKQLEQLQNKRNKTDDDYDQIQDIKAALRYLAGISNISAPPGTSTTFHPGKRDESGASPDKRFTLPPDYNSNVNHAIDELEKQLEQLQNKRHKTDDDYEEIRDIKAALQYLAGVSSISAPPGTSTTFHPGKREEASSPECPSSLEGAETAYQVLASKENASPNEALVASLLHHVLLGCGSAKFSADSLEASSDLPTLTNPEFDLSGLKGAYETLQQSSAGQTSPSFTTWLIAQRLADILEVYGDSVERTSAPTPTTGSSAPTKRQGTITIGTAACELTNVMSLKATLAALIAAYGDPRQAPQNVFLLEQFIVTALQTCGQSIDGWTTLTPGDPQPGGPIRPDPTQSGGSIVPDPYQTGSPLRPGRRARQAPVGDPTALLAALQLLEQKYGSYGSGTIPVPIFLIMENIVTILQDSPGVTVPGWPVLGSGSVTFGPST